MPASPTRAVGAGSALSLPIGDFNFQNIYLEKKKKKKGQIIFLAVVSVEFPRFCSVLCFTGRKVSEILLVLFTYLDLFIFLVIT